MGPKRKAAQEENTSNKKVATGGVAARKKSAAAATAAEPTPKSTPKVPENKNEPAPLPDLKPVSRVPSHVSSFHFYYLLFPAKLC